MWLLTAYVLTIAAAFVVFFSRSYANGLIALLTVTLFNVPIYMFGNSSSSGIFPADVIIVTILVKHFLFTRRKLFAGLSRPGMSLLLLLCLYAGLRGAVAVLAADYGYYDIFIYYGIARWLFFFAVMLCFLQRLAIDDLRRVFSKLAIILMLYYFLAIVHQFGLIDLSGLAAIGHGRVYEREYIRLDVYRAFLGGNAASVGFLSVVGILVSIMCYRHNSRNIGVSAFFLSVVCLVGSGSRSDIVATGIAFFFTILFVNWRILKRLLMKKGLMIASVFIILLAILIGSLPYGAEKVLSTDFIGEAHGTTSGSFAHRISNWENVTDYLLNNIEFLIFGFGPNGFRMLTVLGIDSLGFGHNIYLHTIGELGIIGLSLLVLWLVILIQNLQKIQSAQKIFESDLAAVVTALIIHRLIAGIAVDTLFAIDNMLAMNIFTLFFVGVSLSKKSAEDANTKNVRIMKYGVNSGYRRF